MAASSSASTCPAGCCTIPDDHGYGPLAMVVESFLSSRSAHRHARASQRRDHLVGARRGHAARRQGHREARDRPRASHGDERRPEFLAFGGDASDRSAAADAPDPRPTARSRTRAEHPARPDRGCAGQHAGGTCSAPEGSDAPFFVRNRIDLFDARLEAGARGQSFPSSRRPRSLLLRVQRRASRPAASRSPKPSRGSWTEWPEALPFEAMEPTRCWSPS